MFHIFILTFSLVASYTSFASLPGDNDYYIIDRPRYRITLDQQYIPYSETINQKIEYYIKELEKSQPDQMDDYLNIVLLSPQEQKSNALAEPFPFMRMKIFSSGIDQMNRHSFHLWFDSAFVHELNHLYQMSYSILPKTLSPKAPLFAFLYPNIFLPNLFIEGESTFKESVIEGLGGRLYSGEVRAFVYAQIKHYKDRQKSFAEKLMNDYVHPTSRKVKYFHGAYLFSALSKKFSHKKIGEFFKINGESFLSFFTYNHALKKAFNMDAHALINFYFDSYKDKAIQQKVEPEESLFKTSYCPEINRFQNKMLLMTTDFQSTPKIKIYDPRLDKWSTQRIDIPIGKIFKIDDQYLSRSTYVTKPHEQMYSLFSKGMKPHPTIRSQFVQDILGEDILSIDTSKNIISYELLLNGTFYDHTHSNALFDAEKNIYYFKQDKNKRTLYKNKKPVFAFFGNYGKLVDILPDGSIYFIASSEYGSTLYKYLEGKVVRSVISDGVIQAKTMNDKDVIICEVTGEGNYVYKKVVIDEILGVPKTYSYSFEKIPAFDESAAQEKEYNFQKTDNEFSLKDVKKYSPLLHSDLIFNPLLFFFDEGGFYFNYQMVFQDVLEKNHLNLSFETQSFIYYKFLAKYQNTIHPLQWSVDYQFGSLDQDQLNHTNQAETELFLTKHPITQHTLSLNTAYALFQKGRWRSKVLSTNYFQFRELDPNHFIISSLKETYNFNFNTTASYFTIEWKPSLSLSYNQSYSMNTFPNKSFDLALTPHYVMYFNNDNIAHSLNAQIDWNSTLHLGYEFYFRPSAKYLTSLTHNTVVFNEKLLPLVLAGGSDYELPSYIIQ